MENRFADRYKINSSRLSKWDYSNPGYYFITICTYNKNNFFGKIIGEKMELSEVGKIADDCLKEIPKHFNNVCLEDFIIMPNHLHILFHVETHHDASLLNTNNASLQTIINNQPINNKSNCIHVETHHDASLLIKNASLLNTNNTSLLIKYNNYYYHQIAILSSQTIPLIIKQFKGSVKRICHQQNHWFSWQTRFYDHIIQNKKELSIVKNYIINNPINWQKDKFYKSM